VHGTAPSLLRNLNNYRSSIKELQESLHISQWLTNFLVSLCKLLV